MIHYCSFPGQTAGYTRGFCGKHANRNDSITYQSAEVDCQDCLAMITPILVSNRLRGVGQQSRPTTILSAETPDGQNTVIQVNAEIDPNAPLVYVNAENPAAETFLEAIRRQVRGILR